ncbi:MAG: thioredoxin family protein [Promethearchaeota archaeon]
MVQEIMENELEQLIQSTKIVIVDISTTWCGPCKSLGKVLETKFIPFIKDDPDVKLVKIDGDKNNGFCEGFRVMGFPTMLIFFNGQQLVFQSEGGKQDDRIVGFDPNIDKMLLAMIKQLKEMPEQTEKPVQ